MPTAQTLDGQIDALRATIKGIAGSLWELKEAIAKSELLPSENRGETMANAMLSYRALEDASMRLGKVIQARQGGKSIYDAVETGKQ